MGFEPARSMIITERLGKESEEEYSVECSTYARVILWKTGSSRALLRVGKIVIMMMIIVMNIIIIIIIITIMF